MQFFSFRQRAEVIILTFLANVDSSRQRSCINIVIAIFKSNKDPRKHVFSNLKIFILQFSQTHVLFRNLSGYHPLKDSFKGLRRLQLSKCIIVIKTSKVSFKSEFTFKSTSRKDCCFCFLFNLIYLKQSRKKLLNS